MRRDSFSAALTIAALLMIATACSSSTGAQPDEPIASTTATSGLPPKTSPQAASQPESPQEQTGSRPTLVDPQDYYAVSEGVAGYYFQSASGKWRCAVLADRDPDPMAGCQSSDNTKPSIGVAGEPLTVADPRTGRNPKPNSILVRRGQDPSFAWLGQAEFWRQPSPEAVRVLPYGTTLQVRDFSCSVQESGVSCRDDTTRKGFAFSDAGFSMEYSEPTRGVGTPTSAAAPESSGCSGFELPGYGRSGTIVIVAGDVTCSKAREVLGGSFRHIVATGDRGSSYQENGVTTYVCGVPGALERETERYYYKCESPMGDRVMTWQPNE